MPQTTEELPRGNMHANLIEGRSLHGAVNRHRTDSSFYALPSLAAHDGRMGRMGETYCAGKLCIFPFFPAAIPILKL